MDLGEWSFYLQSAMSAKGLGCSVHYSSVRYGRSHLRRLVLSDGDLVTRAGCLSVCQCLQPGCCHHLSLRQSVSVDRTLCPSS